MSMNFNAGGTINPSTFVKLSTVTDNSVLACASGDKPFGVAAEGSQKAPIPGASSEAAVSGQALLVYTTGDVCLLTCGTGVTRGDPLKPDNSGNAVTASTGDYYAAYALQSGSTNQLIKVFVTSGAKY